MLLSELHAIVDVADADLAFLKTKGYVCKYASFEQVKVADLIECGVYKKIKGIKTNKADAIVLVWWG